MLRESPRSTVSLCEEGSAPRTATMPLAPLYADGGLAALIGHRIAVQGGERIERVYELFRGGVGEFLAVLEGDRFLGLCARRHIGMLVGGHFGFSLYGRDLIRTQMLPEPLCVTAEIVLADLFAQAFSRHDESYYDDVVLLDESNRFLGLIPVQSLVRLQHEIFAENIAHLEQSRREIATKNLEIERDLRLARELQLALLPDSYPSFPAHEPASQSRLRFAHQFQPAGCMGGDFFHVRALDGHLAAVFICDVMGHDVRAALVTAILRALVEELRELALEPGRLLDRMNQELREILRRVEGVMFATAVSMVIDTERREARYAIAGHPAPLLVRNSACMPLLDGTAGMGPAIGLFDEAVFPTHTERLVPGDRLILFTDGLIEAMDPNGSEFGSEALVEAVVARDQLPLQALLKGVYDEVCQFHGNYDMDDDICVLSVEFPAPQANIESSTATVGESMPAELAALG